jgi:CheY-like chemotaxis protein
VIYDSGRHLLTLINDVLDLAKIEARRLELHVQELPLGPFLEGVASQIGMAARERGLAFCYDSTPGLPAVILADEKRLRQVLLNLLGNAVKFTERGSVALRVSRLPYSAPVSAAQVRLRFEVEDTGPGLTLEQRSRIFEPFEQVGSAQQRGAGAGLGLPISQRLARLMGGAIQVSSVPGMGSRFWFEVEATIVEAPSARPAAQPRIITGYEGTPRRILVVDDRPENRLVLVRMLEPLGFVVGTAADGREAVAQAAAERPDLILMDLVMPVMTGFEAVPIIRALPGLAEVPIIAVSASVLDLGGGQFEQIGCDDGLSKPVNVDRLLALLERHLGLSWMLQAATASGHDVSAQSREPQGLLVAPPRDELEQLYELARFGDMERLAQRALLLSAEHHRYAPFARRLLALAETFDDAQIQRLIRECLEEGATGGAALAR